MVRKKKDITERNLIEYPDVFADIVNALIFHGKPVVKPDDLVDAEPRSSFKMGSDLHEQERDIAKYWKKGNVIFSMIGIENQTKIDPWMTHRIIAYDGAAYKKQIQGPYHPGYPVITIVLYFGKPEWKDSLFLKDHLHYIEQLKPYFNDYHINLIDVRRLTEEQINRYTSDFRYIAQYFATIQKDKEYHSDQKPLDHPYAVFNLLEASSGAGYSKKMIERKLITMDDVTLEFYPRLTNAAVAKGIEHNTKTIAERMIQGGVPDDMILKYTQLSKEEIEELHKELQQ